jgi:hypothetical protein
MSIKSCTVRWFTIDMQAVRVYLSPALHINTSIISSLTKYGGAMGFKLKFVLTEGTKKFFGNSETMLVAWYMLSEGKRKFFGHLITETVASPRVSDSVPQFISLV